MNDCIHCINDLDCVATDAYGNKFCAYCGRKLNESIDGILLSKYSLSRTIKKIEEG